MLEVGDAEDVVSDHSHRVRRGDEEAVFTQDHVPVLPSKQSFEIPNIKYESGFIK